VRRTGVSASPCPPGAPGLSFELVEGPVLRIPALPARLRALDAANPAYAVSVSPTLESEHERLRAQIVASL
jgi:hypothetical protein